MMVRSDINHAKTGQRWDYNDLAKSLGMLAILWEIPGNSMKQHATIWDLIPLTVW